MSHFMENLVIKEFDTQYFKCSMVNISSKKSKNVIFTLDMILAWFQEGGKVLLEFPDMGTQNKFKVSFYLDSEKQIMQAVTMVVLLIRVLSCLCVSECKLKHNYVILNTVGSENKDKYSRFTISVKNRPVVELDFLSDGSIYFMLVEQCNSRGSVRAISDSIMSYIPYGEVSEVHKMYRRKSRQLKTTSVYSEFSDEIIKVLIGRS